MERRLKQLEYCQRTADAHIAALENGVIFRILRRAGRPPSRRKKTRAGAWLKQSPFRHWCAQFTPANQSSYESWMKHEAREAPPPLVGSPSFSVLMQVPRFAPRLAGRSAGFHVCNRSIRAVWDLCICLDEAANPGLADLVAEKARSDRRIRTIRAPRNASTATALNRAATLASGDYFLVLGECDRLSPDALHWMAATQPAELIYGDEDRLDDRGCRIEPIFKPDWSPDLLLSCMYFGRTMTVARSAWEQSGGFRPEYEQAHESTISRCGLQTARSPVQASWPGCCTTAATYRLKAAIPWVRWQVQPQRSGPWKTLCAAAEQPARWRTGRARMSFEYAGSLAGRAWRV